MVELAKDAFRTKNFKLSAEIYERAIQNDGPKLETLLGLADSQARSGEFKKALSNYIRCVRFGKTTPANMRELAGGLADFIHLNGAELGLIPLCSQNFDSFFCGKCSGLLIEPVTLPCGHSFCHTCVLKDQTKVCVTCRYVHYFTDFQKLRTNVTLWAIISRLFRVEIEAAKLRSEGNRLFAQGCYQEAIRLYTEAANKAPRDHLVISNRAHVYATLNKYPESLIDSEQIIQLKPDWPKGYYRKGTALSALCRHEEACLAYLQCLALDPNADTAKECLSKELHFLITLCSETDPKHTDIQKALSVSPNALLQRLMPGYDDDSDDQHSEPSTRVSSPTRLSAKSISDENLSVLIADGITKFQDRSRTRRKRFQPACSKSEPLEQTPVQLSFDPSHISADDVECALCMRLLYLPVGTPCGHVFCKHCLDRCLDHNSQCPLCKSSLEDHLAERRQATVDAIEKLIEICLPQELSQRKTLHEEEIYGLTIEMKNGEMEVPIFVCTLGFPAMPCPLHIFEPRYRLMVRRAMETGARQFGMCVPTGEGEGQFADHGVLLEIRDIRYMPDGRSLVDTLGGRRIRIKSRGVRDGYNTAVVELVQDHQYPDRTHVLAAKAHDLYTRCKSWLDNLSPAQARQITEQFGEFPKEDRFQQGSEDGPKWLWWMVSILPLNQRAQLSFLQMTELEDRLNGIGNVMKFITRPNTS